MKNILLFLIVITTLFFGCSNETEDNDLKNYNLNGRVKSLQEKSYKAKDSFGEIIKGELKRDYCFNDLRFNSIYQNEHNDILWVFDINGYLLEENNYDSNGQLFLKLINKYDEKNNIIERANYNSYGNLNYKSIYKRDNCGNFIEDIYINSTGVVEKKTIYKNKYNNAKKLIESETYENEKFYEKEKHLYEKDIEYISFFNEEDQLTYKTVIERLHNGKTKSLKRYNSLGLIIYEATFDKNGNCLVSTSYNEDKSIEDKSIEKYFNNIRIYYKYLEKNGVFRWAYSYRCDKHGNVIESHELDEYDNIQMTWKFEYTYDKEGNWVKRVDYTNDIVSFIIEREIKYF